MGIFDRFRTKRTIAPVSTGKELPLPLAKKYTSATYIGEGGFAWVFAATRPDGEYVAVKVPKDIDEMAGKLFIREAAHWSTLNHENVVRLHDYNIYPVPYLEAELCDGGLGGGRLDESEAVSVVLDVARGIRYAHGRNIIHGDIKPSNILFKGGRAKLSDWGVSKIKTAGKSTTIVGATLEYAAPEELSTEFGRVDERTDIWQLGVVFYELVTGRLPFEGTVAQLQYAILYTDPVPPSQSTATARDVDRVIMTCLKKQKDERYRSMDEVVAALEAFEPLVTFCHRCGTSVPSDTQFCHWCGASMGGAQAEPESGDQSGGAGAKPRPKHSVNAEGERDALTGDAPLPADDRKET
jgi:serine/threonine protein kinase